MVYKDKLAQNSDTKIWPIKDNKVRSSDNEKIGKSKIMTLKDGLSKITKSKVVTTKRQNIKDNQVKNSDT